MGTTRTQQQSKTCTTQKIDSSPNAMRNRSCSCFYFIPCLVAPKRLDHAMLCNAARQCLFALGLYKMAEIQTLLRGPFTGYSHCLGR